MNYQTILENAYRLPSERINGFEARLDGISFSFALLDLARVREFTRHLLQVSFDYESCSYGSRWYENFSVGYGAALHWQHRQGYPIGLCELKGEYFSCLDPLNQKKLIDFIASIGAKTSVLALDIDDYERLYSPAWFVDQWQHSKCKGFKTWGRITSFSPATKDLGYGESVSFGRRGSQGGQKFFCCYDKKVESNGCLDCYRYELTLYKHKARHVVESLSNSPLTEWHSLIASYIQGEIKFLNFHISDLSIKLPSKRPKNCLYSRARWIHRQIPLVYAALSQARQDLGYLTPLGDLLQDAGEKNPKYQNYVAGFRNFLSVEGLRSGPQDSPMG